ncbi:endonuclease [Lampropedia aestuarii]|uniref:Excinuclease cho n=1 Tax=Lampropedia aestuarii TaxID=2562762 RepID=A0A4S5BLM6_9BURK|nr:GIY-YIG nuclease family protein [Lampropedia aestuarii]THJ31755.1 endonuclease [Lampropedia aestuarii]
MTDRPPRTRPFSRRQRAEPQLTYRIAPTLKALAQALPQGPGVYLFWGAEGDKLPLYVGKSIHIRKRVQDHLRNPEEAAMLQQTQRFEARPTTGEIGALLLESQLIKTYQPLYNQRLRYSRQLCSWSLVNGQLQLAHANAMAMTPSAQLFGLYRSAHAAKEAIATLADTHMLCLSTLGLEKASPGKPCFRHMVKRCAGACCGKETPEAHLARCIAALEELRLQAWPYAGPVALVERADTQQQWHVLDNWCYLGSAPDQHSAQALVTPVKSYDVDSYKILVRPLMLGQHEIVPLLARDKIVNTF